jgi:GNAT superfamily N-acetyltransferase
MNDAGAPAVSIAAATPRDTALVVALIRALAEYEKLTHEVKAGEAEIREALFGERPFAEALIARVDGEPVGFALFFHNFSTFTGRPGLWVEDVFVQPAARGRGIGKALFAAMARIAVERRCARMEWNVLDWNEPAIRFYRSIGAVAKDEWTTQRLTGAALQRLAARESTASP